MTMMTIDLTEERFQQLQQRAQALGVTPEDLVLLSIEELLKRIDPELQQAIDYVLMKNADLYRRLA